jgi:hypothetical protein
LIAPFERRLRGLREGAGPRGWGPWNKPGGCGKRIGKKMAGQEGLLSPVGYAYMAWRLDAAQNSCDGYQGDDVR